MTMHGRSLIRSVRRRDVLAAAAGLAACAMLQPVGALAAGPWQRLDAARDLIGDTVPDTTGIRLDLPLVSEDGSAVSVAVTVDSPMTDDDFVQSIHLFADRNPSPEILAVELTPRAGRAELSTRVRLNESQSVIAIARTSRGRVLATARDIRVTISGCLVRADTYDSPADLDTRVRVTAPARAGEPAEVLTLINHPMETGLRLDEAGDPIPERIIDRFEARLNGEPVLRARYYRSLAANPFLRFHVAPETPGTLALTWTEDTGRIAEAEARIRPG